MKLSAVLAIKEPPRFKLAFLPKTIPLGLIKNKLAELAAPLFCKTSITPSIFDGSLPVTRERILAISGLCRKEAIFPLLIENS